MNFMKRKVLKNILYLATSFQQSIFKFLFNYYLPSDFYVASNILLNILFDEQFFSP